MAAKPWSPRVDYLAHEFLGQRRGPDLSTHLDGGRRGTLLATGERPERLSEADANEIAEILGCLPLALAHAAAYLKATRTVTPRAYVARITRYLAQAPRGADYKQAVFATFQTAITKAEEEAPGAAAVLCLASFLSSDAIPDELLRQPEELYDVPAPEIPGAAQSASTLQATLSDPIFTDEAIGALDRLSLVDYSPETQSLSVHRLVQATGRDLVGAQAVGWLQVAIAAVDAAFPKVDFANWAACERLLPHALAVAQQALDLKVESLPLARMLHNSATYLSSGRVTPRRSGCWSTR